MLMKINTMPVAVSAAAAEDDDVADDNFSLIFLCREATANIS